MNLLLYCSYVSVFACLFLSNDFFLAHKVFVYVVAPLGLLPIDISYSKSGRLIPRLCIFFESKNLRHTLIPITSHVFLFAFGFGAVVVMSSALQPSWSPAWFWALLGYLIAISLFMLITARLSLVFENFYETFFLLLSLLAAANAIINLLGYFSSLSSVSDFTSVRFTPGFGRIPDHFPTTGALTYATCLVAAGGSLTLRYSLLCKIILSFCVMILLVALALTQSRGPLLGALVASACSGWSAKSKLKFLTLLLSAAAGDLFLLIPKIGRAGLERLDNHRLEVWEKFLQLARERILLGYGERLEFHVEISDGETLGHAHNIFISAVIRGGTLAGLCFVAAYGVAAVKSFHFARQWSNPIPLGLITLILVAGLVDFDQLIFLADWQWLSFWLPLGLSAACEMRLKVRG